jgi:hypothetical protein
MEDNIAQVRDQQLALSRAFEAARQHLGIGCGSLDVWRSELLGRILSRLARDGNWDPGNLARMAAESFLSETTPDLRAKPDGHFYRRHAE